MSTSNPLLSKFLVQNSREMGIILSFYSHKIERAKLLLFDYDIVTNLSKAYFDFLVINSVTKYMNKQIALMEPEVTDYDSPYELKTEYKQHIASLFNMIKTNLYDLADKNLKHVFIKLYSAPEKDYRVHTTIMLKLLNTVPKDLRIYVREGVIFNSLKVVKGLCRKICRDPPSDHTMPFELNQKNFMNSPVIKSVIESNCETGIDYIQQLKPLFGKSRLIIVLSTLETVMQCMIEDTMSDYV